MQKFLIIKPSSFGDIIHGLQVVQSLKAQMPEAHVNWVVRDIFAPLVRSCSCVDEVIVFKRNDGLSGLLSACCAIRKNKYDYVLDMQGLARSGFMTWLAKGGLKIGRADAREGAHLAYNKRIPLPEEGNDSHALDILLEFLPILGLRKQLESKLSFDNTNTYLDIYQDSIILFPDSRRPEKIWKGFAKLTERLLDEFEDTPIVWMGQDKKFAKQAFYHNNFYNLVGRTRIEELVPFIENSQLVIANDSGAMHLTAALQKNILALFGPTDPNRFGPYETDSSIVLRPNSYDLNDLSVDEVFDAIDEILP